MGLGAIIVLNPAKLLVESFSHICFQKVAAKLCKPEHSITRSCATEQLLRDIYIFLGARLEVAGGEQFAGRSILQTCREIC